MEDDLVPEDPHLIVGFDLETEKWLPAPMFAPPAREDHGHTPAHHHVDMSLAEVNGFLVAAHPDKDVYAVKLWLMMDVDAEISLWFLLYKIPMAVGRE